MQIINNRALIKQKFGMTNEDSYERKRGKNAWSAKWFIIEQLTTPSPVFSSNDLYPDESCESFFGK